MSKVAAALVLTVLLVTGGAIALGTFLNFGTVRVSYTEIAGSRFAVVGERLAETIEQALTLGLPLAGQETLTGLLAREQATDPLLLSVDVTDDAGRVLFSSDPARQGLLPSEEFEASLHRREVKTDFGLVVGTVVLRVSRTAMEAALDGLATDLTRTASFAAGAAALLALIGIPLLLAAFRRQALGRAAARSGEATLPPAVVRALHEVEEAQQLIARRLGVAFDEKRAGGLTGGAAF